MLFWIGKGKQFTIDVEAVGVPTVVEWCPRCSAEILSNGLVLKGWAGGGSVGSVGGSGCLMKGVREVGRVIDTFENVVQSSAGSAVWRRDTVGLVEKGRCGGE